MVTNGHRGVSGVVGDEGHHTSSSSSSLGCNKNKKGMLSLPVPRPIIRCGVIDDATANNTMRVRGGGVRWRP